MSTIVRTVAPSAGNSLATSVLPTIDLENVDWSAISQLVVELARTKKGGYTLQSSVLFTKSCEEFKARASLSKSQRLPDNIAGKLHELCENVAALTTAELKDSGFILVRQSHPKIVKDYKNLRVNRAVSQSWLKIQDMEDQLKDIKHEINTTREKLNKVNEAQPRDAEHRVKLEQDAIKLDAQIEKDLRLQRAIQAERDYQEQEIKKAQAKEQA